jgi:hypothetical protein
VSKQIWKYPIQISDCVEHEMPRGARLLCVQVQWGMPCLWAIVDPEQPRVRRRFWVVGTGHPFPNSEGLFYIGTVQLSGGTLIFHFFVEAELPS